MILYYSRPSPFARKALVALIETKQLDDVVLEEVKIGPMAPGEIVPAANPLGKIPTLLLPNGSSIIDSKYICRYMCRNICRYIGIYICMYILYIYISIYS